MAYIAALFAATKVHDIKNPILREIVVIALAP
jgi:hypothetical protein